MTVCAYCGTKTPARQMADSISPPQKTPAVSSAPAPVAAPASPSVPQASQGAPVKKNGYWHRLFGGRMNRLSFLVAPFLVQIVLTVVSYGLGLVYGFTLSGGKSETEAFTLFLTVLLMIPSIIYSLSFSVRRCHDMGKKGTFMLWGLIPIVNIVIAFRMTFGAGAKDGNQFGPPPKPGVHMGEILGFE